MVGYAKGMYVLVVKKEVRIPGPLIRESVWVDIDTPNIRRRYSLGLARAPSVPAARVQPSRAPPE